MTKIGCVNPSNAISMVIDDGKVVSGEILATSIETHGGLEEAFHQYATNILGEVLLQLEQHLVVDSQTRLSYM
jgi:hypothetical protein